VTLPSPTTAEEFAALEHLNTYGGNPVSRSAPGVLVKFGCDHDAEVRALQFVHGRLSVPTPRVLHHAPFTDAVVAPWDWMEGVWYLFMEECPGVPLETVIGGISPTEFDHIANQLLVIIDEMRSYTSKTIGSVTGGPYDNRFMSFPWHPPHAFPSIKEYLNHYRGMFLEFCGPEFAKELFSHFPTDSQVHFTHGDLLPQNILVDGSKVTAIIDWETAVYYPKFWEYCQMHDPGLMTPACISKTSRNLSQLIYFSQLVLAFPQIT